MVAVSREGTRPARGPRPGSQGQCRVSSNTTGRRRRLTLSSSLRNPPTLRRAKVLTTPSEPEVESRRGTAGVGGRWPGGTGGTGPCRTSVDSNRGESAAPDWDRAGGHRLGSPLSTKENNGILRAETSPGEGIRCVRDSEPTRVISTPSGRPRFVGFRTHVVLSNFGYKKWN